MNIYCHNNFISVTEECPCLSSSPQHQGLKYLLGYKIIINYNVLYTLGMVEIMINKKIYNPKKKSYFNRCAKENK